MANIIQYLQDILTARYGKDVRQSIHDAIEEINNVNEANIGTVQAIANTAQGYASDAQQSATSAQTAQTGAETAQTNAETAEDGAEHFYNETVAIAQTLSNAIIARGTIEFADLPDVSSTAVKDGFMWNISDNFTTTSDFVEGAGVNIPMGANVYKVTINNVPKWDVLAGTSAAVFVGTEAQIAQAEAQGLISENTMVISLDGEMPYELTSSMILHGSESVENVLNQINSDLGNKVDVYPITSVNAAVVSGNINETVYSNEFDALKTDRMANVSLKIGDYYTSVLIPSLQPVANYSQTSVASVYVSPSYNACVVIGLDRTLGKVSINAISREGWANTDVFIDGVRIY